MTGFIKESIVVAFVLGGVLGAVTAWQLLGADKIAVTAVTNLVAEERRGRHYV